MNDELLRLYAAHEEEMTHDTETKDMSFKVPRPFHHLFRGIAYLEYLNLKETLYMLIETYLNQKLAPMKITLTRQPKKKS